MRGTVSFSSFARRASRRLRREFRALFFRTCNRFRSTYPKNNGAPIELARLFGFLDTAFVEQLAIEFPGYRELVRQQASQSIEHRFDLLGSGPVVVKYGMRCRGLEGFSYEMSRTIHPDRSGDWLDNRINRANRLTAKYFWRQIDEGYFPIDWQLDFKSGYRWCEETWNGDIQFGDLPGVDVKVPWELSRMQHLPTLALACHFAGAGVDGFDTPETYAREFRNQVLDFMATNPPGFGVNWVCAMDVAIRISNLLVARDIIVACGARFDDEFDAIFASSVRAHARHIVANLEWSPEIRGNHYIANVVGLLLSAIYLPCDDETDAWLAFSVQELISEVGYQFHEDGSNFEASVCYHRLSSEMVVWASAFLMNLAPEKRVALGRPNPKDSRTMPPLRSGGVPFHPVPGMQHSSPLPEWYWARLAAMGAFTCAITRPDGHVVQFGDNDSGRFITLGVGDQLRAGNDPSAPAWSLDHGALTAAIRALIPSISRPPSVIDDPASLILRALAGFDRVDFAAEDSSSDFSVPIHTIGDDREWGAIKQRLENAAVASKWVSVFEARSAGLVEGLQLFAFGGMGCYVIKSPRLYLAIRCGELGLVGLGAHAHCDQLAIELVIDGETRVRDPGTYIYTPLPDRRNTYRSVRAHHVPRVLDREPADLTRGVFDLRGCAEGECLYFGPRGFIGRHAGYGPWVYRMVALEDERIAVYDFAEGSLSISDPTPESLPFSPGYGRTIPV